MGLKLTVTRGDKITVGDDVVIEVKTLSDKQTQLEFKAPIDIEIIAHFKDQSKQFKNLKKANRL